MSAVAIRRVAFFDVDVGEYAPLLIIVGYAATAGLLGLSNWLDRRSPLLSKLCLAASGVLASTTTLFWLTRGSFSGPFIYVWELTPLALIALVRVRRYRQHEWMDRLTASSGRSWVSGSEERPDFGVLPAGTRAVSPDAPSAGFMSAIAVDVHGNQVLGVQYDYSGGSTQARRSNVDRAIGIAEGTYNAVQLRTPKVPTVIITPRPGDERVRLFGPDSAGVVRPFEDARLSRNLFGALRPAGNGASGLEEVPSEIFVSEFARQFTVRSADPEFVRTALPPETQRQILEDPWFRVREVSLDQGVVWTSDAGQLTEAGLLANARHLTQFISTIPRAAWRYAGDGHDAERFIATFQNADTSTAAWYDGRRTLTVAINERRIAANRTPLSPWWIVVRVCLIVLCLALIVGIIADPAQEDPVANAIAPVLMLFILAAVVTKVTFFPKQKRRSSLA